MSNKFFKRMPFSSQSFGKYWPSDVFNINLMDLRELQYLRSNNGLANMGLPKRRRGICWIPLLMPDYGKPMRRRRGRRR